MQVGIVQFIKGSYSTGEETFLRRFPEVQYHVMGEGFTWETQDRERDTEMALHAWHKAQAMMQDPNIDLILLDEINIALKYKYIPMEEVIHALANKPFMQHVILTGRGAGPELIDIADTVTEMKEIKHAFKAGIRAQQGVEL